MKRLKQKKGALTTQTTQLRSWARLSEAGKDLTIKKSKNDENVKLLLSLCDSLDELYEKLNRLSNILGKKIVEHNLENK